MPYIESNISGQIYYRRSGSGPALLLIHGFPSDGSLWKDVSSALAAHFTVIVPDLPGVGESDLNSRNLSMDDLAESVYAIIKAERIDKIVVAGHSMGGYVALALVEKYPKVLAGIALIHSTAAADDEGKKEVRRKSVNLIRKGGREVFIRQMVPNIFADRFVLDHPAEVGVAVSLALKLSPDSLIAYYDAMRDRPDRVRLLGILDVPIQFILGKEDNILPFTSVLNQSIISNRTFVSLYRDCGHMSMIEKPLQLIMDLNKFTCYCYNATG